MTSTNVQASEYQRLDRDVSPFSRRCHCKSLLLLAVVRIRIINDDPLSPHPLHLPRLRPDERPPGLPIGREPARLEPQNDDQRQREQERRHEVPIEVDFVRLVPRRPVLPAAPVSFFPQALEVGHAEAGQSREGRYEYKDEEPREPGHFRAAAGRWIDAIVLDGGFVFGKRFRRGGAGHGLAGVSAFYFERRLSNECASRECRRITPKRCEKEL